VYWYALGFTGGRKGGLLVKSINARSALISVFLGLAVITPFCQAEDYYIYQAPNGVLVISNKEPPPGSKIIKQQNFSEAADNEVPHSQQPNNPPPNLQPDGSPRPSKTK
jgi:hypothetical protein